MTDFMMIGLTDPGMIRTENEDSIGTRPEAGLAVLADGMGGHQAGEVASKLAVETIIKYLTDTYAADRKESPTKRISEAIRRANATIFDTAHKHEEYAGMGSTIVTALFRNGELVVGHVGDSRLYRLRQGKLEQMTEDHSVIQELVNRGLFTHEEARASVGKNLVTRALGVDAEVLIDVNAVPLEANDLYLLCSDGLNDVVSDEDITRILTASSDNLYTAAFKLVTLANQRGGPDNISVILIRQEMAAPKLMKDGDAPTTKKSSKKDSSHNMTNEFKVDRHEKFIVDDDGKN
ncbi:MAG: Stp1/IreP family PP2C-type Ser/Thr phosphatase [Pseudomonadota bacterium]